MRPIDADELIETCQRQIGILEAWQKESGTDCAAVRKGYTMIIDMVRSAETLNMVSRHEYDRTVSEYEFLLSNLKEETEIAHVGYDDAQMGREK